MPHRLLQLLNVPKFESKTTSCCSVYCRHRRCEQLCGIAMQVQQHFQEIIIRLCTTWSHNNATLGKHFPWWPMLLEYKTVLQTAGESYYSCVVSKCASTSNWSQLIAFMYFVRTASDDMAVSSDCTAGRLQLNSAEYFFGGCVDKADSPFSIHWCQLVTGESFKNLVWVLARPTPRPRH